MLSTLLALALLSSAAQAPEGPISTRKNTDESAEQLQLREARAYAAPLPDGAPADDLGFVGWCLGRVSGHLETGRFLNDDDKELMELADSERRRFENALAVAARRDPAGVAVARQAQSRSQAYWADVRKKEKVWAKFEYATYSGLPGRCEHAARRVAENITAPPAVVVAQPVERAAVAPRVEPSPNAPVGTR
ncbi:MAG TPA: hypothetical protein VF699_11015 [Caulobacteraceae bacterium]|jgi:hypothetical protein